MAAIDGAEDSIVQISRSNLFAPSDTVTDTVPAIIQRYVRATPLPLVGGSNATHYYWRVRGGSSGPLPCISGSVGSPSL